MSFDPAKLGVQLPDPSQGLRSRVERGGRGNGDVNEVARQFESVMLLQLVKAMRATVPENEDGGFGMQTANDLFDQTLADKTAGSLGLAPMIARELGAESLPTATLPTTPLRPIASSQRVSPPSHPPSPLPIPGRRPRAGTYGSGLPNPGEMPVDGVVSSDYGWRDHPIHHERRFHGGLDIAAPRGTEIRAVQAGRVVHAGRKPGYGNVVEIEHRDGTQTRYAHASRVHVVVGDRVETGESVADVGSTGQATGPHLHFEVRKDGNTVDPKAYLERLRRRP